MYIYGLARGENAQCLYSQSIGKQECSGKEERLEFGIYIPKFVGKRKWENR